MKKREINKVLSSGRQPMGEHFMYQPLPAREIESIDPFLLLHHHGPHVFKPYNQGLPFGPHPHRGFETLTFIYKGEVEHADSQGFRSVIKPGGVQWMTAGRGIVHSENIPAHLREKGGEMEIIQLWMNLPKKLKMTPPAYQGLQAEDIPVEKSEDGLVKTQVIAGKHGSSEGTAKSMTNMTIFNVTAKNGGKETYKVGAGENILFYNLRGELNVNGKLLFDHQMIDFADSSEDTIIEIQAQSDAQFIICTGQPLKEPVVSQGPFVMNTTSEVLQAMRDYQLGKMGVM
ncbi:pirin family protein [Jiulongibacter sp. NS-SX5]|uniref:pirin family protein n=1 Tax=Jiulongibacter sp. NS-SX5 TaxID=3463854 RepID=UPI004057FD08